MPDSFLVHEPEPSHALLLASGEEIAIARIGYSHRLTADDRHRATMLFYFEGCQTPMKTFLLILGFLAAFLIVAQLVMGLLILQGQATMRTAHQHSGYLTVAVSLVYIGCRWRPLHRLPDRNNLDYYCIRVAGGRKPAWRSAEAMPAGSLELNDRRDSAIGGEQAHQEASCRLIPEKRARNGRTQAAVDDVAFSSSPAQARRERPVGPDDA